ncbi:MAG TPA: NAD(P)H-dependent oxidoreductase [Acidimicrobiales bacterium]|nr:NAD(P)H-dependent oxidoreductase [Acidimicrobiales bacterium]
MARLLIVHHTPSPSLHTMLGAIRDGAGADGLEEVEVVTAAALSCTAADVLAADGYVLLTPANLGTMAGALKHFFDTIYYPCLEETQGRPFGCAVHGNSDVDGALRDVTKITTGLGWSQATDHVRVLDTPEAEARDACWNLGATVAATVLET